MSKQTILFTLILLAFNIQMQAQTTVVIPANTISFTTDSLYHFIPGAGLDNKHICADKHMEVTEVSTYMERFYLASLPLFKLHDRIGREVFEQSKGQGSASTWQVAA